MSTVLVTGANGFIAVEVIGQLLEQGDSVIGTVRSEEKAEDLKTVYGKYIAVGKLTLLVSSLDTHAISKVFNNFPSINKVIHLASSLVQADSKDQYKDVIIPATNGTVSVLDVVYKYAPNVKRIVLTSSITAYVNDEIYPAVGTTISDSDDTWSTLTLEEGTQNPWNGYAYSKKAAEESAWKFMNEHKDAKFDLKSVCPAFVIGPQRVTPPSVQKFATTNNLVTAAFYAKTDFLGGKGYQYVDIRNTGKAHVKALDTQSPKKRFLLADGKMSFKQVTEELKRLFPDQTSKIATVDGDIPEFFSLDTTESHKILGLTPYTFEETVKPLAETFLQVAQSQNK